MAAVNNFYLNAKLPKSVSSSLLDLIPKRENPHTINDYIPISLIVSVYKTISKILSTRLKVVLNSVISGCQSAFLSNRQIL